MDRDFDIEFMDRVALKDALQTLRNAIREHKGEVGHDRCYIDDDKLYAHLPEGGPATHIQLPPQAEHELNCRKFWASRQACPIFGDWTTTPPREIGTYWAYSTRWDETNLVYVRKCSPPNEEFFLYTWRNAPDKLCTAACHTQWSHFAMIIQPLKPVLTNGEIDSYGGRDP